MANYAAALNTGGGAASSPSMRAEPTLRQRLGDGIYLVLLGAFLLPGVAVLSLDSSLACEELWWFVALLVLVLATVMALHLLVWLVPRPVSHVDNSPLSGLVAALVLGAPVLFGVWSLAILFWPGGSTRTQCDRSAHRGLWGFFAAVVSVGGLVVAVFLGEFVRVCWQALTHKPATAPVSVPVDQAAPGSRAEPPPLDNGRWLTMESRRIRGQMVPEAVPRMR